MSRGDAATAQRAACKLTERRWENASMTAEPVEVPRQGVVGHEKEGLGGRKPSQPMEELSDVVGVERETDNAVGPEPRISLFLAQADVDVGFGKGEN
jgi:hypothetical protein